MILLVPVGWSSKISTLPRTLGPPLGQFNTICRSRHGNFHRTMVDTFDHEGLLYAALLCALQGSWNRVVCLLKIKAAFFQFIGKSSSPLSRWYVLGFSLSACAWGDREWLHTPENPWLLTIFWKPWTSPVGFCVIFVWCWLATFFVARCWVQPRNALLLNLGDRSHRTVIDYCRLKLPTIFFRRLDSLTVGPFPNQNESPSGISNVLSI